MRSDIPKDINLNVTVDVTADVHIAKLLYDCLSGIISAVCGMRYSVASHRLKVTRF